MTEKLFYEDSHRTEFTAKVISCEEAKDGFCVVLDQTAFFRKAAVSMPTRAFSAIQKLPMCTKKMM